MAALDDLRVKTGELLDEGMRSGMLTPEEHRWRLGHLAQADTVEALEVLVEDLLDQGPAPGTLVLASRTSSQVTLMASRTFTVPDLGRKSEMVTVMGSSKVDLRGLSPDQALTLELVTIMGDTVVEVPEGIRVRVDCTPVMGDCRVDQALSDPDARVRITGVVLMGDLKVVVAQTVSS